MPYILSKLANTQIYTQYVKGTSDNLNIVSAEVEVKGGADVTNSNLITPEGVLTQVSAAQLDILKANKDFQRHLENGIVKYFNTQPNIEKTTKSMSKDKSKQLTKDDYKKANKKAPDTEGE
jgi:hypothetical protein